MLVRTNLITRYNQPQAPDQAVAGGHAFLRAGLIRSPAKLLSAPLIPLSAIGDQPGSEASGRKAIAQLELLL